MLAHFLYDLLIVLSASWFVFILAVICLGWISAVFGVPVFVKQFLLKHPKFFHRITFTLWLSIGLTLATLSAVNTWWR